MISIPAFASIFPKKQFRPKRVKIAIPITGWGIIMGRSTNPSMIFLPKKFFLARIYASGVPKTAAQRVATRAVNILRPSAAITSLSYKVLIRSVSLG